MSKTPQSDALAPTVTETSPHREPVCGGSVLLAEDGPTNRKLICALFEEAGLRVDTAENGQVGVILAAERQYDLILMDMQMPVMDGYTATAKIRQRDQDIPIIALTAHAMAGDKGKCLAAGCSDYLAKPIDGDALLKVVFEILGRCRRERGGREASRVEVGRVRGGELISTLDTSRPIFQELVAEFVDYARGQLAGMRSACEARNWEELARLAHALKGAGGTAGFPDFTCPSRDLERCAQEEDLAGGSLLLDELETLVSAIRVPELSSVGAD